MPFLIDGYNLYHAMRKYSEPWSEVIPQTMCELIEKDMNAIHDWAIVVFDGTKPRGSLAGKGREKHVSVVFSGGGQDADSIIVGLIGKNTAPRRLVVVSSDNQLRTAAKRRRATALTANEYLLALLKRQERKPVRTREPRQKQHGLFPGETGKWMELFGFEPDEAD
jgi:predicted RNA-binding protein with PIN domain